MQAANAGHRAGHPGDDDVRSYGLNIKLPFEQAFNPHLDIKMEFDRFSGRLDRFMALSNAVVVAPGGVGTLLELLYTWQLEQVEHIGHVPIVLLGDMWAGLLEWIREGPLARGYLDAEDMGNVFLTYNRHEALHVVVHFHNLYHSGDDARCAFYRKYRLPGAEPPHPAGSG